jgi:hypothetical protein
MANSAYLPTAIRNLHSDRSWWRVVLIGGLLMNSLVGLPLAVGLVIESMENSRNGYPVPLPPWADLGTRYLIGILGLLIDFVMFVLPALVGVALMVCVVVALLLGGGESGQQGNTYNIVAQTMLGLLGLFELAVILSSASPVARLLYIESGQLPEVLGAGPARVALTAPARSIYLVARFQSLPIYIPSGLIAVLAWQALLAEFPGHILVGLVLIWLSLSALLYAHLIVAQVYALAEQDVRVLEMQRYMPR